MQVVENKFPQGLKPRFLCWLYAGDKSPAYRPNEFFRSL
jgi:hypothetical protein